MINSFKKFLSRGRDSCSSSFKPRSIFQLKNSTSKRSCRSIHLICKRFSHSTNYLSLSRGCSRNQKIDHQFLPFKFSIKRSYSTHSTQKTHDIALLHSVFNDPRGPEAKSLTDNQWSPGLFGYGHLHTPKDLLIAAEKAQLEAVQLIQDIKNHPPGVALVEKMDDLSNVLCLVVDMCEFLRSNHKDENFYYVCERICTSLKALMETLNTDVNLFLSLKKVVSLKEFSCFHREAQLTAKLLLMDFEESAVQGTENQRKVVRELTSQITAFQFEFEKGYGQQQNVIEVYLSSLASLPSFVQHSIKPFVTKGNKDRAWLAINRSLSDSILRYSPDSKLRQQVYVAAHTFDKKRDIMLNKMLKARYDLSKNAGYKTYAHKCLGRNMAQNPENVDRFLYSLAAKLRPQCDKELEIMQKLKMEHEKSADKIQAWDRLYYAAIARKRLTVVESRASNYFPLGSVMEGIGILCDELFDVQLIPSVCGKDELWSDNVFKLAVTHRDEGLLGYIYADFFSRPGKNPQPSQYTIRGGKRLSTQKYQQPIVVLSCNFYLPHPGAPTLLGFSEVETLFHEIGHCLHSMFGRADFQHVSGTRCNVDFVEIPSILMEHFAGDYRVLSRFARHYQTNEVLPRDVFDRLNQTKSLFSSYDCLSQVLMSIADQEFHGELTFSSPSELLDELQTKLSPIPHVPGTSWSLSSSHIVGYGAGYYSYLWSGAFARLIWEECFQDNPFDRDMGSKFRNEFLNGRGRDSIEIASSFLGFKPSIDQLVESVLHSIQRESNANTRP